MRTNQIGIDAITHDVLKNAILLCWTETIEASPVEIGNAGHEGEAERMTEREDEVADTATIDMVSDNIETGVGFQQSIEDMNRFACRGGDDLRVEGAYRPEIVV